MNRTPARAARAASPAARIARVPLLALLLLVPALAGCTSPYASTDPCWREADPAARAEAAGDDAPDTTPHRFSANAEAAYAEMGFDGTTWPDLTGQTVIVLDHGAFDYAFGAAEGAFETLTGADVQHVAADDAGSALQLAIQDQQAGGGSFDVLYGVDNVLMAQAEDAGVFEAYTPLLGADVDPAYRFVPTDDGAWLATPVDRGYIAVNVDERGGTEAQEWSDLVAQADDFVTQDPRFSSPGLGFLMATVAAFGPECYLGFWDELFAGGVTVTNGWTEAYVDRFTGGYGQYEDGTKSDKPIVTSYTSSPAYEAFYGETEPAEVFLAPQSVFEQVQTMGILNGTQNRAAAEAWIEFTLTDDFQVLAAEYNAIYPVTTSTAARQSVTNVYDNLDPRAGTDFEPAALTYTQVGDGVEDWVAAWADLYDLHRAG